ncbi:MAG: TIGR02678 family protein [Clostridiales bacterium]|nr:TIGR02678 family protein [Clostridiales bacterium]
MRDEKEGLHRQSVASDGALELLLNRRWILKSENKEAYYQVRDSIGELRSFVSEKLGCQIIENSLLVKMEKIPAAPESFMGIEEFTSKEEYAFFCILLMFLEDRDAEEQFILSQLTDYLSANMPDIRHGLNNSDPMSGDVSRGSPDVINASHSGGGIDWTVYTNRRHLIRVLRYAVSQGLLRVTDGSDDLFMDGQTGEVLYENTGTSRYFMRNFSRDIADYGHPEDFEKSEWFEMDEDRGLARRHRVYKRLIFTPGMYREKCPEEDFEYLKYYGRRLADELEQIFDCRVHIHRSSAFLLMGEECRMGKAFPGNNALSDILLLCFHEIQKRVEMGRAVLGNDTLSGKADVAGTADEMPDRSLGWGLSGNETIRVDQTEFERMLKSLKAEYGAGFPKNYREIPEGEFVREVMDAMEKWTFISREEETHRIVIWPAAGKLKGSYPEDFE